MLTTRRSAFHATMVVATAWLASGWLGRAAAERPPAEPVDSSVGSIVGMIAIPEPVISAGVPLGGLSDLAWPAAPGAGAARTAPTDGSATAVQVWALTDRGPNGTVRRDGKKVRTLVAPEFVPSLVLLEFVRPGSSATAEARVVRTLPLAGHTGKPLSGRPNGGSRDDDIFNPKGTASVGSDPNGVDSEAVVVRADGSFWIAEEYRPSLLHVSPEGRVVARYVPEGHSLPGADTDVRPVLPAAYGLRRDNRGFEAIAATTCGPSLGQSSGQSSGGDRLWLLMQSPLDGPDANAAKVAKKTGNVRLLGFDPAAGRPAAEHVYRLGDPGDPRYLTRGAPPDDGKLCAMATIDDATLLVLEQDDSGLARLYAASLAGATDTLGWPAAGVLIDTVADLPAAGIVPVGKTLVADLTDARRAMGEAAGAGAAAPKLEGLVILDPRHVAIVNDNDFTVHDPDRPQRSLLMIVRLPEPLALAAPAR